MRRLDDTILKFIDRMAAGSAGPVAIAVSGGSDSLSLLYHADAWSRSSGRDLLVLTVDHGMRAEAAGEAAWVRDQALALGHAARILTWAPTKRSQEAARWARHTLLAGACREAGADLLLLGHTRSDIHETLLMRLSRPGELPASVGPLPVSVSPFWPEGRGLRIGRPLFAASRELLMARLRADRKSWMADPSNESRAYERVRVRALATGLSPGRLEAITADAMRLRALEDATLANLAWRAVSVDGSGLIEVKARLLPPSDRVSSRLLAMVLQLASGTDRSASPEPLASLLADVRSGGPEGRLTLGGGWVQRRRDTLLIGRDPGESTQGWQDGLWDGRYERAFGPLQSETLPFLVRQSAPDSAFREIISDRLALWISTLREGAALAAEFADVCETSPASAATTHPG